jgi:hypothetical protein
MLIEFVSPTNLYFYLLGIQQPQHSLIHCLE